MSGKLDCVSHVRQRSYCVVKNLTGTTGTISKLVKVGKALKANFSRYLALSPHYYKRVGDDIFAD